MLWAELLPCLINSNEQNKTMLFKAYEIIGVFEKNHKDTKYSFDFIRDILD